MRLDRLRKLLHSTIFVRPTFAANRTICDVDDPGGDHIAQRVTSRPLAAVPEAGIETDHRQTIARRRLSTGDHLGLLDPWSVSVLATARMRRHTQRCGHQHATQVVRKHTQGAIMGTSCRARPTASEIDYDWKTKLKLDLSLVRTILLYGSETWSVRVEVCRLEVFDNDCLMCILRRSHRDRAPCSILHQRCSLRALP